MHKCLIGATFVLEITKAVWLIELSTFVVLMYTTPAYADLDASQNPCNSIDATLKSIGKYIRGISRSRRTSSSERRRCHSARMRWGTGTSHSHFSLHMRWRRIFGLTIAGEHLPKMLYHLAMPDSNVCLVSVSTCFSDETTGRKVSSEVAFHSMPNTLLKWSMLMD